MLGSYTLTTETENMPACMFWGQLRVKSGGVVGLWRRKSHYLIVCSDEHGGSSVLIP